jgi:hypothetical protein
VRFFDPVQEDGLADSAQSEQEMTPVGAPLDDPCQGDGGVFDDLVSSCQLGRLVPGSGCERVSRAVHSASRIRSYGEVSIDIRMYKKNVEAPYIFR